MTTFHIGARSSRPFTVIPMLVTNAQNYIGEQLIEA